MPKVREFNLAPNNLDWFPSFELAQWAEQHFPFFRRTYTIWKINSSSEFCNNVSFDLKLRNSIRQKNISMELAHNKEHLRTKRLNTMKRRSQFITALLLFINSLHSYQQSIIIMHLAVILLYFCSFLDNFAASY